MTEATCSVEGCDRPRMQYRKLCVLHKNRVMRTGSVGPVDRLNEPVDYEDRFWPKVNKEGPLPQWRPDLGPCWLWTAGVNRDGYGKFDTGRKHRWHPSVTSALAHRSAYEILVGRIADGFELDHLCRVRRCVNPEHLEPVTHAENMLRLRRR